MLFFVSLDVEMAVLDAYSVSFENKNSLFMKLMALIDIRTNTQIDKKILNFIE
jgi:NADH:ubiquinone oxidoreductase subunit 3 (subunit A)